LPTILDELSAARSTGELLGYAALVTAVVVLVRFAWVVVAAYMPRMMRADGSPPWKGAVVLSWSGMRGAVSLAAALALPLTTDADAAFPNRDLIVFLTFGVILGTLVVQGLTLPGLIRWLDLEDDGLAEKEEAKARIRAAEAALARLDELVDEDWVNADTAERMRGLYGFRRDRFRSRFDPESDGAIEGQSLSYQRLRRELLEAERQELRRLRLEGRIDDDVVRRVQRDLDLENERLDI
jgi:CPA1 family monovalent cation:H+ antiporter